MDKIVHSEAAPGEAVRYTFASGSFELKGKSASYETDDVGLLAEASTHPWLRVERAEVKVVSGAFRDLLKPEDDPLSSVNDRSNDPEAVEKSEKAKAGARDGGTLTAIDASRDQKEESVEGGVAKTVKSDETPKSNRKKD